MAISGDSGANSDSAPRYRLGTRAAVPSSERQLTSTAAFRGGVTGVLGVLREGEGAVSHLPNAPRHLWWAARPGGNRVRLEPVFASAPCIMSPNGRKNAA